MGEGLSKGRGFDLLAMGRPEEPGCYCAVNELLRAGIDALAENYRYVIVDGEAGPEQLNRRVMKSIDYLLVVSDMSARSLGTAAEILRVARAQAGEIDVGKAGLMLNRVRGGQPDKTLVEKAGAPLLGWVPEDDELGEYDRLGKPLLDLPGGSPCVAAVRCALERMLDRNFIFA
jgi:CO dehydrogenase maturation factor